MANAVMIIPDTPVRRILPKGQALSPKDLSLHQQNWVFAQQFRDVAPGPRQLITVPLDGSLQTDFAKAIREAAAKAEKGGMVILFTGHGTRAACTGGACTFGQALSTFAFETVPETKMPKTKKIDAKTLTFLDLAEKQGDKWVPKARTRPGTTIKESESQGAIDALAPKWEILQVMKSAFTANGTDRLVLLTCSVGTFPKECQALADIIKTTVVAYRDKIATAEFTPPFKEPPNNVIRPVYCWCTASPNSINAPRPDPLTTALQTPQPPAMEQWILANWKKHPYFSLLPLGPGVECKPGGQPNNFG
jgi:hypothetical protein